MDVLTFISSIIWPIVAVLALFLFKSPIDALLKQIKSITIKADKTEINLSIKDATNTLNDIFEDVLSLVDDLNDDEKKLYKNIRASDGRKTVRTFLPGFKRGEEDHIKLQRLRERKLIRPFEGSKWTADKHPVVTRFSSLVEKICPEKLGLNLIK